MASNDRPVLALPILTLTAALTAALLAGCSVTGSRESPINEVTRGSPTVLEIYRGQAEPGREGGRQAQPRQNLREQSRARPVTGGDDVTERYWSALEPLKQRFARVPNPDLVMVVYPHLSKGKYPVPGYVTVFPMYEQTYYALPGEVAQDLIEGRSLYRGDERPETRAKERSPRPPRIVGQAVPEAGN